MTADTYAKRARATDYRPPTTNNFPPNQKNAAISRSVFDFFYFPSKIFSAAPMTASMVCSKVRPPWKYMM